MDLLTRLAGLRVLYPADQRLVVVFIHNEIELLLCQFGSFDLYLVVIH